MLENQIYSKPAVRSQSLFSKLDSIARETGLIVRESKHFSAGEFVLTLMKSVTTGKASFGRMASTLGKCELAPASRQALWKRIGTHSVAFMIKTLHTAMDERWGTGRLVETGTFGRILIEDSSQEKLHKSNHRNFPGHGNAKTATSGCKLDLSFDLLTGEPVHHTLHKATMQDKLLGKQLVDIARPGDLILRDMGYFSTAEFTRIEGAGAHWMSRLPANVDATDQEGVKLEKLLRKHRGNTLETTALIGGEAQLQARLVAVRASKEVAAEKRRQRRAAAAKQGRTPPADTLLRDGWHIIVCSIPEEKLDAKKLTELYSVRWQIEITFRAWKQSGELRKALNRKSSMEHLLTLMYASILRLVLTMKVASALQTALNPAKKTISLEKLACDLGEHLITLTTLCDFTRYTPHIPHVIMETRQREPLMVVGIKCLG